MSQGLSRRGLLRGIIAACAAPVIIRPGIIMPIKPLTGPYEIWEYTGEPALKEDFLTIEEITRQALAILHERTNFITTERALNVGDVFTISGLNTPFRVDYAQSVES